jgi:hypothetical protein
MCRVKNPRKGAQSENSESVKRHF